MGKYWVNIWYYLDSMIAPLFLLTSGAVFLYLFKTQNKPFAENERVKRGFKRSLFLILLGYLIQIPDYRIFTGGVVYTDLQWQQLWGVDILQVIGMSVIMTIGLLYIAEKTKLKNYIVFGIGALVLIAVSVVMQYSNLSALFPEAVDAYFTSDSGSKYPLFPFGFYFLAGSCIGCFMSSYPEAFIEMKGSSLIMLIGVGLILLSFIGQWSFYFLGLNEQITNQVVVSVFRSAGLIILALISVVYVSIILPQIPKIFILIGRNTLLVFVVHIVIIERTFLSVYFQRIYNVWESAVMSFGMLSLMILLVLLVNKLNLKNFSMMRN
jgi:fucose 4-O-acetylase-like acetyltransferase